ncbi:MAG: SAM domain-containing protein [Candidatus Binatia bacterium]
MDRRPGAIALPATEPRARRALRRWLEALGLAQYADRFVADDIDLDVLPSLSEQDLAELGVSMGHRKRMLKAIAELSGGPAPPSPAGDGGRPPRSRCPARPARPARAGRHHRLRRPDRLDLAC